MNSTRKSQIPRKHASFPIRVPDNSPPKPEQNDAKEKQEIINISEKALSGDKSFDVKPPEEAMPRAPRNNKVQCDYPLSTLLKQLQGRVSILVDVTKQFSPDCDDNELIIIQAVQKLSVYTELRELKQKINQTQENMANLYHDIVEKQPEIGEIVNELGEISENKQKLTAEITSLEIENNELNKPKVTKEQLREYADKLKKLEMLMEQTKTKNQLRYTKAKEGNDALNNGIANLNIQIDNYNKRIALMTQKGSIIGAQASSQHQGKRVRFISARQKLEPRPNSADKKKTYTVDNADSFYIPPPKPMITPR